MTLSAASATSDARGPQRWAGRCTANVSAALDSRVKRDREPEASGVEAEAGQVHGDEDAERSVAEGADRLGEEDQPSVRRERHPADCGGPSTPSQDGLDTVTPQVFSGRTP